MGALMHRNSGSEQQWTITRQRPSSGKFGSQEKDVEGKGRQNGRTGIRPERADARRAVGPQFILVRTI
uniref:Uncharacterized protein n=1 Tax=Anopheles atroparvus TaxID=41427 RepID=A0AAG5DSE7_ANOAO